MTYDEAIDFLYSSLPMFHRVGKAAYKANLDTTLRLDQYFGHPHRSFPSIHVAGTNGKGSVSHMLASVFQQAGYRTGLYTSPHLLDFRERIRVNGKPIPRKKVTGFITAHRAIIDELKPSFFEMTVAMAFEHFAGESVEMAIIETGMGGRLDSTNILRPALSLITNISMDHTEFLGSDPASIAREKGGIIKPGIPVVIGPTSPESEEVLLQIAAGRSSPVCLAREKYRPGFLTQQQDGSTLFHILDQGTGKVEAWPCALSGAYQQENIATVLCAVSQLREMGRELAPDTVREGLKAVSANTGIMGRWQTLGSNPRSICDSAHNLEGIRAVMDQIRQIPWKELHVVWGMVTDKDTDSILPLLPRDARYYFTPSSVPRSMDSETLREKAAGHGLRGSAYGSVKEAYRAACEEAGRHDLVFTGGSTFVVADLLQALGFRQSEE